MTYELNFKNDNYGKKVIDEPFGMSEINLSLNQKTDGGEMGRDVSFSGGELSLQFGDIGSTRDHQVQQLLYYRKKFGFESDVVLTITTDNGSKYVGNLDFATAETNNYDYIKCKLIESSDLQIVKARKKTKVDVLSDKDIDGNFITPLTPGNLLILAKPVIQKTKYTQSGLFSQENGTGYHYSLPINGMPYSDIQDSYIPFTFFPTKAEDFNIFEAKDTITNMVIDFKFDELYMTNQDDIGSSDYSYTTLEVYWGKELRIFSSPKTPTKELYSIEINKSDTVKYSANGSYTIPLLERGDKVWIFFYSDTRSNYNNQPILNIRGFELNVSATSTSYSSISKSLRLVDVMRQVVKSISGLEIDAPRFEELGDFYDNRLVNGRFLRGLGDSFKVSLEDIENSFPEFKGDWEIDSNGKIFFGIEKDFYTNIESGFFPNTQFSSMNETFDPKAMINEFMLNYDNFQSQKENEEANSNDDIHGESTFTFFNKNVENSKEAKIQWTRSAFSLEEARKKAIEIQPDTASQDDDTLFCIDSIETTFDNQFSETTSLQHTFDKDNYRLILQNDGSINFISLGILVDSIFTINTPDLNAGTYRVFSVKNNSLELTRLVGTLTSAGDGIRSTNYRYTLDKSFVPFTNYTDQGFSETSNLNAANSYSNRRYSLKRNIYNYWNSYLATANLYWKSKPLVNTWYKNNPEYTAKYNGVLLTEGADFIPSNPILSPILYNDIIFANVDLEDYITLQSKIRSERGYIRSIDNNNHVKRIYPIDMEYTLLSKELKIKANEKYEPVTMTINTDPRFTIINNETIVDVLDYEFDSSGKLLLYDTNRYRLYNGVYWFETSVNGAIPGTLEQLDGWLKLI